MTEKLATLHDLVAAGLVEDLEAAAEIEDPVERHQARHQARAQAITFLKNHDYRGVVDDKGHLAELQKQLNAHRAKGRGGLAALQQAAADFEAGLGGNLQ